MMKTFTDKAIHGLVPAYISKSLSPFTNQQSLRSSNQNLLAIPQVKRKTKGDSSFAVLASRLWNNLALPLYQLSLLTVSKNIQLTSLG